MISGGRAVSENLQLDRLLPISKAEPPTVKLNSLPGITVKEFDWQPLVRDIKPGLDPLARFIPSDQHALFFPSFRAMVEVATNTNEETSAIYAIGEPISESAHVRERYERQLGLSLDTSAKIVGPLMIGSVAVTGGDPYFRTGTDVAVLFEAKVDTAVALLKAIDAQVEANTQPDPKTKTSQGKLGELSYTCRQTKNRSICSYVARLGDAVVVTNSLAQLQRLADTEKDLNSSLAVLDEYRFFRERYKLGDTNDSGLLIISDATIRRWCGPKWRIASSRRTRAVALMAESQAQYLDDLVKNKVRETDIKPVRALPDAGKFSISSEGISSQVYGSLEFQTPIRELDFDLVTKQESQFYRRWRDGYQRNWSNFFDPIAVRFSITKQRLDVDMTVMPLVDGTDYQTFVDLSKGAKINARESDRHAGTMAQWTLAINRDQLNSSFGNIGQSLFNTNPFDWMGETFTVYMEQDKFWKDLAAVEPDKRNEFMEKNASRLPVGLTAEIGNQLKLVFFLPKLRVFIEQMAPEMTKWETKKYKGHSYMRVSLTDNGQDQIGIAPSINYAVSGKSLLVSLSEPVLHRALDRHAAKKKLAKKIAEQAAQDVAIDAPRNKQENVQPAKFKPMLGESMCVQIDKTILDLLKVASTTEYQATMQRRTFANLPILNEWKRLYPEQDPVAIHKELWQRTLLCPGGGKYVWNDQWKTMESTVYGHPAAMKQGPSFPAALEGLSSGNFGITFENDGLRARVVLDRTKKP